MDVCVVFVVRTVAWNVKWHEGRKDLNSKKWIKRGKTPDSKKKSHRGHGCLCGVCCKDGSMERKVTWRRTEGFQSTKWIEGEKPRTGKKKKKSHLEHGCLSLVSVVCCQVEVSATSWSLVQRSPTDCGVSQMCVIMIPRRNEEAQAHIGLSSHTKKKKSITTFMKVLHLFWPT
jgi:hypothetical protein